MNSPTDTPSPAFTRLAAAPVVAGTVFLILAGLGSLSLASSVLGAAIGFGATVAVLSLLPARTQLLVDDDRPATRS
ncbi:MAG: hypothetical protein GY929_22010 [Actinomycetia bacterium]|nr:hypothetical protein [Actinomycetes bacterium]